MPRDSAYLPQRRKLDTEQNLIVWMSVRSFSFRQDAMTGLGESVQFCTPRRCVPKMCMNVATSVYRRQLPDNLPRAYAGAQVALHAESDVHLCASSGFEDRLHKALFDLP
jgi:hypothetical protein